MYKFLGLVLLSALAAVGAKRIDLNAPIDELMERLNSQQRQQGTASAPLPEISLGPKVKYTGAKVLGMDSFKRTGDCWQEIKGNEVHFDISYGFDRMEIELPHLEVSGTDMSAHAKVRDNSAHMSYTVRLDEQKCQVKLNEFRIEKLENVEFRASNPQYDGINVDPFFKLVVKPTLNGIVNTYFVQIEAALQGLCNVKDFLNVGHVKDVLMSIL